MFLQKVKLGLQCNGFLLCLCNNCICLHIYLLLCAIDSDFAVVVPLLMKKFLHSLLAPFVLFIFGIVMLGCEHRPDSTTDAAELTPASSRSAAMHSTANADSSGQTDSLKSGNMFYIVRDVAGVQLQAGDYVEKIHRTQQDLEAAIQQKDSQQLQQTMQQLQSELTQFNQSLQGLNLRSQEINQIRDNIINSNKKLLSSDALNGNLDYSQIDVQKIENQLGSVENEMIKLAAMLIPSEKTSS